MSTTIVVVLLLSATYFHKGSASSGSIDATDKVLSEIINDVEEATSIIHQANNNHLPEKPATALKDSSNRNIVPSWLHNYCKGKASRQYRDPTRCDGGFIACKGGLSYRVDCPSGLWYDPSNNRCDAPAKVQCNLFPQPTPQNHSQSTPHGIDGFCKGKKSRNYNDPDRCDGVIACSNGYAYKMDCPANLWYQFETDRCEYPEKVDCKVAPTPLLSGSEVENNDSKSLVSWTTAHSNKWCPTERWKVLGCYNTKVPYKRGKLLVYWRKKIEWKQEKHPIFASRLACACAAKARQEGVKMFGLHFWGECWALEPAQITPAKNGDCTLADGLYKTKCNKKNHRYSYECLGEKSYYTYEVLPRKNSTSPKRHTTDNGNKMCPTQRWETLGCYDTKVLYKRGKLLVYWRKNITWDKENHPTFASRLACACAAKAREEGVKMFGLHFWGECWALEAAQITPAKPGDCTLANGLFTTKCNKLKHRYSYECLGEKSYYTYKLLPEINPIPTMKPTLSEVTTPSRIDHFCKGKQSRNYPDPTRCDGFIACSNGIAYKMDCPAHLWYDFKNDQCDYPANVKCKLSPRPTLKPTQSEVTTPSWIDHFCKGKKSRNYPDPTRCDGFIACSNGIAYKMDCPAHLWYDFKTDRCDYPANVKCKLSPRPTLKPTQRANTTHSWRDLFCKGKMSRNYPDLTRCDGFITCSNGIAYKMDCPAHLWYDFKSDRCDYPAKVNCKSYSALLMADDQLSKRSDPWIHAICMGKTAQKYPDPKNCNGFIIRCDGGISVRAKCSEGMRYNAQLRECDAPEKVNCQVLSKQPQDEDSSIIKKEDNLSTVWCSINEKGAVVC